MVNPPHSLLEKEGYLTLNYSLAEEEGVVLEASNVWLERYYQPPLDLGESLGLSSICVKLLQVLYRFEQVKCSTY